MKKNLHPEYHMINVTLTSGETVHMRSTFGAEGEKITLPVDSLNHPAYTGIRKSLDTDGKADKFNKRYGR